MSESSPKALLIGGLTGESRGLETLLADAGIALLEVRDGGSGLRVFYAERPDVVLLYLEDPDLDGLSVLATIREMSDVPILALVADEAGEEGRVRGLRAGADDCVAAATSDAEVQARLEALLRRSRRPGGGLDVLEDDFVRIDRARHRVEVLGEEVELTPIEFRMLEVFVENPGVTLGHGQLLDMVWGDRIRERDEVKLYVCYLRRKLDAAAAVAPVETVRGVGYRYQPRLIKRPATASSAARVVIAATRRVE